MTSAQATSQKSGQVSGRNHHCGLHQEGLTNVRLNAISLHTIIDERVVVVDTKARLPSVRLRVVIPSRCLNVLISDKHSRALEALQQ